MRLLVLGGGAFVGRWVVSAAVDRGWSVTTFNRGRGWAHPEAERLIGDRLQPADLEPTVARRQSRCAARGRPQRAPAVRSRRKISLRFEPRRLRRAAAAGPRRGRPHRCCVRRGRLDRLRIRQAGRRAGGAGGVWGARRRWRGLACSWGRTKSSRSLADVVGARGGRRRDDRAGAAGDAVSLHGRARSRALADGGHRGIRGGRVQSGRPNRRVHVASLHRRGRDCHRRSCATDVAGYAGDRAGRHRPLDRATRLRSARSAARGAAVDERRARRRCRSALSADRGDRRRYMGPGGRRPGGRCRRRCWG